MERHKILHVSTTHEPGEYILKLNPGEYMNVSTVSSLLIFEQRTDVWPCYWCNKYRCAYTTTVKNIYISYGVSTCYKCKVIFVAIRDYYVKPTWITRGIDSAVNYAFLGKETTKKMRETAARYQVQLLIPTIYDIARVIARYYIEIFMQ